MEKQNEDFRSAAQPRSLFRSIHSLERSVCIPSSLLSRRVLISLFYTLLRFSLPQPRCSRTLFKIEPLGSTWFYTALGRYTPLHICYGPRCCDRQLGTRGVSEGETLALAASSPLSRRLTPDILFS